MAQHSLLNWKKALAFGSQFLLPDGTLPSGNNVEDYDNHVLNHMVRYLKGRTSYSEPANVLSFYQQGCPVVLDRILQQ